MSRKSMLIRGTLILTLAGIATRVLGFFYRIFLSQTFGARAVGVYQMVFPVYALGFSLSCAGIQQILSRLTAKYFALGKEKEARELLSCGLFLTVSISVGLTLLLQNYADQAARVLLQEPDAGRLLLLLSYAFPFAAVHSCICGYYYGRKRTGIPALSQLLEQVVRISAVCLIFYLGAAGGARFGISLAVAGMIAGECSSSFFCLYQIKKEDRKDPVKISPSSFIRHIPLLLFPALPLTGSRVLLHVFQSIEAISIPLKLQDSGMARPEALALYGVLTGMALPCILFPSALTGAASSLLLPEVARLQAMEKERTFLTLVKNATCLCIALGSLCCFFLFFLGQWIGTVLFQDRLAGELIQALSFLCPFLYTNNTLISMINGTGKTGLTFAIHLLGLVVRILGIFFLIPLAGIRGYLWGLLASQILTFLACLLVFYRERRNSSSSNGFT